ncbi:MAG TPA: tetratricopeptide repeat protein [Gemmatimonadales bacterium]|nr:tetratricopeptide repeat protein [Gemmatimonadales bacterium]
MSLNRAVRIVALLAVSAVPSTLSGQVTSWVEQRCGISPGDFRINGALLYLQNAYKTRFADQEQKDMNDARKNLLEALTTGGQTKNPAAWYYLGRYYVKLNDAVGADSAFARAEVLAPKCHDDIAVWRRVLWVPLINAGVSALNANDQDSAIATFTRANAVYRNEPQGLSGLAGIYANWGSAPADTAALRSTCAAKRTAAQCDSVMRARATRDSILDRTAVDSAVKYYQMEFDQVSDAKYAKDRRTALFNTGVVYTNAKRWPEAVAAYHRYLAQVPGDMQGTVGLATAFQALGMKDSSNAMYQQVLTHADSAQALDLFQAGAAIFQSVQSPPDTSALGQSCRADARKDRTLTLLKVRQRCDAVTSKTMADYHTATASQYRLAAQAFEAGLAKNPYYRDGIYNLANTYYVLEDTAHLMTMVQRLLAVDPLNRNSIRLQAAAWQLKGKPDSTLYYLKVADSMSLDVTVSGFSSDDQGAAVTGVVSNRGKAPSAPGKLVFEFLDVKGAVVSSQDYDLPAVPADGNARLEVHTIGAGIVGWRYHKG